MNTKKIAYSLIFLLGFTNCLLAQFQNNLNPNNKNKPPHEQRIEELHKAKIDYITSELELSNEQRGNFETIYNNYDNSQRQLFSSFEKRVRLIPSNNQQAREKIFAGFELSQKFLDLRKSYAEEFLKVISPMQLDRFYKIEKKLSRKIQEKKHEKEEK
ncbi:hypothetical protein [Elizabethkingia sp. JS20170427COW]|uniref:hypothetical protein n=1 Tax=Elizabethkingia sp. JS20170427COW TaxID=2583851 RepID=UPI0011109688|nr:hypothetical protein [Elizabethkingia sp. JS20170427COW]QCX53141.1 hypothetical protein FGE20_05060 [Elizabethkingia sp. JS20170427COW]